MNDNKIRWLFVWVILLLGMAFYSYIVFVNEKKEQMLTKEYRNLATNMKMTMQSAIFQKEKATASIAIALVDHNQELVALIKKGSIPKNYFVMLSKQLRDNTNYKNIWIQVIDKNLHVLHRSWSEQRGDSVAKTRQDIARVFQTHKVMSDINVDKYTLSIRALVPVFDHHKVIGVVEVVSHFNSIAKMFQKEDTHLVVLLDKKYKKILYHPYTKLFVKEYYIANFNIDHSIVTYMQKQDIEALVSEYYVLHNGYFMVPFVIHSFDKKILAYAFMIKNKDTLSYVALDFIIFKWIAFGIAFLLFFIVIFYIYLFKRLKKQKSYYQNIIDSSTNVMVIHDATRIVDANKIFFEFITEYKTLDVFNKREHCICDFFVQEKGYLQKTMGDLSWLEYLLKYKEQQHKVKIVYRGHTYYFVVSASLVDDEKHLYSVVFTDITKEENYKFELENLSIRDPLTNIGNRRYFTTQLQEYVTNSKRYPMCISLIMFDIDFFKKINDTYGHDVGDDVLVFYTKLIQEHLRENDIFCRIGGEEFMIILPYITKEQAEVVAEKLRALVEASREIVPLSMSFGVSEYKEGEEIKTFLKRVDDAVYDAKENGRNRVCVH